MDGIEKSLQEQSNGKAYTICSSDWEETFGVRRTMIRHMINAARSNGSPICSGQKGYYVATDKEEIKNTIDSLRGRITKMEKAIAGLEACL